jgi:DNA mismatch repair protein MutL
MCSPASELLDKIIHIYGQDIARVMLPVNLASGKTRITGYVSKPELLRSNLHFQSFFINDRSINSRAIGFALRDGYGTLIPKGRFPISVLKIYVDTKDVDVNVHPTKNQVRLNHERDICDMVTRSVRDALTGNNLIPGINVSSMQSQQSLLYEDPAISSPTMVKENVIDFRPSAKDTDRRLRRSERFSAEIEKPTGIEMPLVRVLGQVYSLYILAETMDGLMIIDQHAAHERVFFELIRASKKDDSQELIVPINMDLDLREKAMIKEIIPYLEAFGFRISEFGHDTFAVTAVPVILGKLEDPLLVHDIISDILSQGKIKDETGIFERVTKSIACQSALKAGAVCSTSQMESLVKQLLKAENPYTCPHGRPTMISFNRQELDKLFKRS